MHRCQPFNLTTVIPKQSAILIICAVIINHTFNHKTPHFIFLYIILENHEKDKIILTKIMETGLSESHYNPIYHTKVFYLENKGRTVTNYYQYLPKIWKIR